MQDSHRPKRIRGTPKREGRVAPLRSVFASEVVAENVRALRGVRGFTQEELADRMVVLGHAWTAGIVGFVERSDRTVTIDELVSLAIAFGGTVGELLDPTGPDGRREAGLFLGLPVADERDPGPFVRRNVARMFARSMVRIGMAEPSRAGIFYMPIENLEPQFTEALARDQAEATARGER